MMKVQPEAVSYEAKSMSTLASPLHRKLTRNQSIGLVVFCTFIGAVAQVLFKIGANQLKAAGTASLLASPWIILGNFALIGGLALYGLFTLFFIFALRDGELSVVYPVITLNYVWVMLLSVAFFHEALTVFKIAGVSAIMLGVIIIGKGSSK